jgi:HrpA-like RNA helicase
MSSPTTKEVMMAQDLLMIVGLLTSNKLSNGVTLLSALGKFIAAVRKDPELLKTLPAFDVDDKK